MLLTRCDCCLVSAIVIMASIFGQSTAQNFNDTTIIDLTTTSSRYTRMVIVSRVPVLRILLPESPGLEDITGVTLGRCPCELRYECDDNEEFIISPWCRDVTTENLMLSKDWFELKYTSDTRQQTVNITIDSAYGVGCRNYMHPLDGSGDVPVNLTCEPVPVNTADFNGNVMTNWTKFSSKEEAQNFVQNCSMSPEDCFDYFMELPKLSDEFVQKDYYSLSIPMPASNRAWYVASFTVNDTRNRTYVAPYTFLYRWPTISTHHEFSLEIFEPASNYDQLQCKADSFPPIEAFAWTRDDTPINSSFPRYTFTNVTTGTETTETITISEIMFEDSAIFTCNVDNLGGLLKPDVSYSVRLRVKHRLRPLWPAVGIIGVGILVAVFIIIGHFWDKAVEKYRNEPSNPSHHKRLQSITSTADETSNNVPSGKKSHTDQVKYTVGAHGHSPVKRLSSARIQLLEEPQ